MSRVYFDIMCDSQSEKDCKGCSILQCPLNPIYKGKGK